MVIVHAAHLMRGHHRISLLEAAMFRYAFLAAFLLLLWLFSHFTDTVHIVQGNTHVFAHNWVPWFFLVCLALLHVAFAEVARRFLKDRVLALLCLLLIPLYGLLVPKLVYERVEVSPDLLVHRREPPHTQFNVNIPWDSIVSATKIEREKPGLFAPNFYNAGYEFKLRDGRVQELPSNTVLTQAQDEIDRVLAARGIPVDSQTIPIPQ
jgi:hypothetical protein